MPFDITLKPIEVPYLVEIAAFLLGVVIIVPIFKKIRLSPILGFLAVGALIGPHSLAIVKDVKGIQHFAELGVIFLLFTIGLELSFERLKSYAGVIFGLGSAQVISCAVAIGGIAYLWGNSTESAIIIGLCLSLSSTAMVMQLLTERGELATRHGRNSFSILLFQDLAVVPILILLSLFGQKEDGGILTAIGMALFNAVVAIVLIVVIGRLGLRKLFAIAARTHSIDVFTAMTLLTILAISMLTGVAGLSMALGAFMAGLLLAETEFRHQIEGEIEPFKGLFLGLFFMSVGMNIDFVVAFENGLWLIISVFGLIALKSFITLICALLFRIKFADAIRSAILLAEAGEFAFVVIGQATLVYDLVDNNTAQFMVATAGISMMFTPALASMGQWISKRIQPEQSHSVTDIEHDDLHDHIVIAGFGRVGASVSEILQSQAIPYVAIDNNPDEVSHHHKTDKPVYMGDASRSEVLKHVGIERASALLITMNDPKDALRTLDIAKQHWPDLTIIVRSRDTEHSQSLIAGGANRIVPETLEASLQLSNYVLRASGYSRDEANDCIDSIRRIKYSTQSSTSDIAS